MLLRSLTLTNSLWVLLLILSITVQLIIPTFGDEAYFVAWGHYPSFGYYDHPPLPGWISSVLILIEDGLGLSQNGILHRITVFIFAVITALLLSRYFSFKFPNLDSNALTLSIFALPLFVFVFNMYFNDSILPFLLLGFFVATESSFNAQTGGWRWLVFAGICFGLALLTKYSAGVYYIGTLLFFVSFGKGRRFLFRKFFIISLIAGGLFSINLVWNYYNCSVNFGFNFSFRKSNLGAKGLIELAASIVFLFGPAGFWVGRALLRNRGDRPITIFTGLFLGCLVSTTLFSLLRGEFGLHWGIPLIFLFMLAGAEQIKPTEVRKLAIWNVGYLILFIAPFLTVYALDRVGYKPLGSYKLFNSYGDLNIVMDIDDGSLVEELRPFTEGKVVAAPSYGLASQLANNGILDTVMFSQMVYGRNSDVFVDFRVLDGRDMVYVSGNLDKEQALVTQVFDSIEVVELTGTRQEHPIVLGKGFNYDSYRELMILPVVARFYEQSKFPSGACYMDKYKPDVL